MGQGRNRPYYQQKIIDLQNKFIENLEGNNKIRPHVAALKIIAIYVISGYLWILLSDRILSNIIEDTNLFMQIQTYKGWFYVLITALIFYYIIYRKIKLYKKTMDSVCESYEELSAAHEELIAMDEELIRQYNELERHRNALMKSEERYHLVIEGANDGIWEWDIENDNYFSSLKWKDVFGYDEHEVPNKIDEWRKLIHPEDREKVRENISNYLKTKAGVSKTTYRIRCKNGDYRWILCRAKGIWDKNGNAIKLAGSQTDITSYMKLQEKLHREKEMYKAIVDGASVFIFGVDKDEKIFEFNLFAEKLTGYKKKEVIDKKWSELFIPKDKKGYTKSIIQTILDRGKVINQENQVVTKDGSIKDILWNNSTVYDGEGNALGLISVGTDITDRKSMENKLKSLAFYDQLTGLPNREQFERIIKDKIDRTKDAKKRFALLYLDLDDFKKVNDTFGHFYGDKLLKNVAMELQKTIKDERVARLSGDEFGIIISDVKNLSKFNHTIITIMNSINKLWVIDDNEFYITCSIGIAIYPNDGKDFDTLFKNADTAMYTAKNNSKNTYAFYTGEMYDKALRAIAMEKDLRNAILNHEFDVYYQPIINFKNGEISSLEALVRWVHPDKGVTSPMEFIPFAEETGLIVDIGEEVIINVCRQLKKWHQMKFENINISINLSAIQLRKHNLINRIKDISNDMDIKGQSLIFEITENVALDDLECSVSILNALRKMNAKVALDDFGTGYSSLNYLNKLPIDIIKIDKEFIKDIPKDTNKEYIAKTIIDLAHNMGFQVTAEGVETLEQYKILKDYGCDFAQGYLFSKPINRFEIESLLKSNIEFSY